MIYIGIDPGLDGAISYKAEGDEIKYFHMPLIVTPIDKKKVKRELNVKALQNIFTILTAKGECICYLEDVHSIFGAASKATFNFGKIIGQIQACLICTDIPFILVQPKEWQKNVWDEFDKEWLPERINKKGKTIKSKLNTKATSSNAFKRLYPDAIISANRNGVLHDGIVDSILIMHYGIE